MHRKPVSHSAHPSCSPHACWLWCALCTYRRIASCVYVFLSYHKRISHLLLRVFINHVILLWRRDSERITAWGHVFRSTWNPEWMKRTTSCVPLIWFTHFGRRTTPHSDHIKCLNELTLALTHADARTSKEFRVFINVLRHFFAVEYFRMFFYVLSSLLLYRVRSMFVVSFRSWCFFVAAAAAVVAAVLPLLLLLLSWCNECTAHTNGIEPTASTCVFNGTFAYTFWFALWNCRRLRHHRRRCSRCCWWCFVAPVFACCAVYSTRGEIFFLFFCCISFHFL